MSEQYPETVDTNDCFETRESANCRDAPCAHPARVGCSRAERSSGSLLGAAEILEILFRSLSLGLRPCRSFFLRNPKTLN